MKKTSYVKISQYFLNVIQIISFQKTLPARLIRLPSIPISSSDSIVQLRKEIPPLITLQLSEMAEKSPKRNGSSSSNSRLMTTILIK